MLGKDIIVVYSLMVKQAQENLIRWLGLEQIKAHSNNIGTMLDQNKDKCYKIINRGDGVYFGRKTFMRLYVVFCIFTGIILLEVAYGLLKLFGG